MGGTFNPIHFGHLILARDAVEAFGLDQVIFIPCANPPHKRADRLAAGADRLAMIRKAIRSEPGFCVDDMELKRGGISYSVDTLHALHGRFPSASFYFVIGTDMYQELPTWRKIGELTRLCVFVVMYRPGFNMVQKSRRGPKIPARVFAGHRIGISSSEIRDRVAQGLSIRNLVPDAVARYILDKKLYQRRSR